MSGVAPGHLLPYASLQLNLGPDSIYRCCLASIGNPIVEIRRS